MVATGKDIIEDRGVRRSAVGEGEAAVCRESKTGESRRAFGRASHTKRRATETLGIVKAHQQVLPIRRGGDGSLRST